MDEQYEKLIQLYSNWSLCNCCCNNCSKNQLFRFQKCYYLIPLLLRPGAYFPFHSSEPTNSSLIRKSPLMTSSPSPHPFHPLRLAAKHLSTSPAALSAPKPELFISCAKEIHPRTSLPWLVMVFGRRVDVLIGAARGGSLRPPVRIWPRWHLSSIVTFPLCVRRKRKIVLRPLSVESPPLFTRVTSQ
jgi:hypothetical protein